MSRMKTFHNFMCGVHPVRVIYGEGEVLYLAPQTTVQEVLQSYPHHFVCQPGGMIGSTFSSSEEEEEQQQQQGGGTGNQMLSLDTELESGCIYFLLPLPKLFPAAPSSAPSCTCFSHLLVDCEHPSSEKKNKNSSNKSKYPPRTTTSSSPLKVFRSPHRIGGLSSPFRSLKPIRSLSPFHKRSGSKSRVLPESNLYSGGNNGDNIADLLQQRGKNCQWRPRLGCISEEEDDLELLALEELKNNNGVVVRQQLTTTVCNKATSTTPHSSGSHGSPLSHRLNSLTVTGTSAFGGIGWPLVGMPSLMV